MNERFQWGPPPQRPKTMAIICGPRLYEYEGWFFEVHSYCGPWPLKKDGDPRSRAGRTFYKMYSRFNAEPDKEQFRVGGGCKVVET